MAYPAELIRQIAQQHGFEGIVHRLPSGGMVNEAWRMGDDAILRITLPERLECMGDAAKEALVVPSVHAAGVLTPKLIAYGEGGDLAPHPYTIYEYVPGRLMGCLRAAPAVMARVCYELGAQLGRLHATPIPEGLREVDDSYREPDDAPQRAVAAGAISEDEAAEVRLWLGHLARCASKRVEPVLIHDDVHAWNLLVNDDNQLTAILDWGDAGVGDPASDFSMMPLASLPVMLKGYEDAGGQIDVGFVARTLLTGAKRSLWDIENMTEIEFDRRWWRMPPGGWTEIKSAVWHLYPDLAPAQSLPLA